VDGRNRGGSVASAGLLPLSHATAVIAAFLVLHAAACWWTELACDTIAARRSGRSAALGALKHFLHDRRALPAPLRLIATVIALRSHPPLLLRR
jgi:hypothetical protein